jgi:glycosyltransferase involved in cell wall biosynthesis
MRILILASYAPSLRIFRGPLIEDLIALGHDVAVAAPDIDKVTHREMARIGAAIHETPLSRNETGIGGDIRYFQNVKSLIGAVQPDLVLTYTIKPNIWGALAARLNGVASAAMVTGLGYAFTDTPSAGFKQNVIRALVKRLYRLATSFNQTVFFQNPDDLRDFIETGCLANPDKVVMVNGSGVDVDHFAASPLPKAPVFTMIARLLRNKGVREFCEAANVLKTKHQEARFVLIGPFDSGPDAIGEPELSEWIGSAVEYVGPLDDVRPALAECSVYVLPSYREGTPRSVLEAMACGRPIITSDAPGCRETVEEGVNGLLVPVADAQSLANAMEEMLANPSVREGYGAASRAIAEEKYAVDKVNAQVIKGLIG